MPLKKGKSGLEKDAAKKGNCAEHTPQLILGKN